MMDLIIILFLLLVSSIEEILSDSKAANFIKPPMSGAYHILNVFFNKIHMNKHSW